MRNHQQLLRLMVFRSSKHIYAQIVNIQGKVIVAANSNQKDILQENAKSYNIAGAEIVGNKLGEMAKQLGVKKVVFDRSGYKFHGRVKALAESVKKNLEI